MVTSTTYLGIRCSNNLSWGAHVEDLFTKCIKLSISIKRHRTFRVLNALNFHCIKARIIHFRAYCSTGICADFLKNGFILKRVIRLIVRVSDMDRELLVHIVI